MQAADETCAKIALGHEGWFADAEDQLLPAIQKRNQAFSKYASSKTDEDKRQLQRARSELRKLKRRAKADWLDRTARRITKSTMSRNAKDTWAAIKTLQKGPNAHHRPPDRPRMKLPNGSLAANDEEDADVLAPHFHRVYNRTDAPVDFTVLDEVEQRPTVGNIDHEPTFEELKDAIKKMRHDKAPGPSGVTSEALKALPDSALTKVHEIITAFWRAEIDYEEWHCATLSLIYKGKGEQTNPNNYRGVCLRDMLARVLSSILSTRLLTVIKEHGVEYQFGSQPGRGCTDGLFTVRSLLQLRRQHNQESWGLFVDLVKAFDTANHELLFKLLEKYGTPQPLIDVIRRLYANSSLNFSLGMLLREIPYSVGVQQGDNMAPVLFLFLIQAMSETLERRWDIEKPQFRFLPTRNKERGRLVGQTWKTKGSALNLFCLLYVDDGSLVFATREDMIRGANFLHAHMARFGLIMHVGDEKNESKTKAMFFPKTLGETITTEQTSNFDVAHGHVSFAKTFKYLGATITPDLRDDTEIEIRLKKGKQQMGALSGFINNKRVKASTKYQIYNAIVTSTVLWGCESWTISAESARKLDTFHHQCLRRIRGVNMHHVRTHRIANWKVRKTFNATKLTDTIAIRQLKWLKRIANMQQERLPRQLVTAWVNQPRKTGKPQLCLRHTYANSLQKILPEMSDQACLCEWMPHLRDKTSWAILLAAFKQRARAPPAPSPLSE